MTISKSKYIAGVQCLKRLYLQVHEPELSAEPDASAQAVMEQGREVGLLARRLFPGGVEVCGDGGLEQAIRTTQELIANPEVPAIFEGAFENQGVVVKTDILQRRKDNRWRLIEVKSTTDLKDQHLDDVAIQSRVVSRSGVDLASSCLAHVNRNYVFDDSRIDPWRFFRIKNLTRRVDKLKAKLIFQLQAEFAVLAMLKAPDIAPGRHCTHPVTCEFYDRCNSPRPDDHVGYLPLIHASAVEELEEMGIESIQAIPDDFRLT
jgi:predicted RecB family nuclease